MVIARLRPGNPGLFRFIPVSLDHPDKPGDDEWGVAAVINTKPHAFQIVSPQYQKIGHGPAPSGQSSAVSSFDHHKPQRRYGNKCVSMLKSMSQRSLKRDAGQNDQPFTP
jgi:hypothetical protein